MRCRIFRFGTPLGLELAADYFLGTLKLRETTHRKPDKLGDVNKVALTNGHSSTEAASPELTSRMEKFFHSAALLPSISLASVDWQVDNRCVVCVAEDNQRQTLTASPSAVHHETPMSADVGHERPVAGKSCKKSGKKRSKKKVIAAAAAVVEIGSKKKSKAKKGAGKALHQRKYSPAELTAAIDEVERGRVGTRKAAILYGIPRSTLRNKVGKLATQKSTSSDLGATNSHTETGDRDEDKVNTKPRVSATLASLMHSNLLQCNLNTVVSRETNICYYLIWRYYFYSRLLYSLHFHWRIVCCRLFFNRHTKLYPYQQQLIGLNQSNIS